MDGYADDARRAGIALLLDEMMLAETRLEVSVEERKPGLPHLALRARFWKSCGSTLVPRTTAAPEE